MLRGQGDRKLERKQGLTRNLKIATPNEVSRRGRLHGCYIIHENIGYHSQIGRISKDDRKNEQNVRKNSLENKKGGQWKNAGRAAVNFAEPLFVDYDVSMYAARG